MNIPKRILVGTDFSDTAKAAFDYAVALARVFDAEIILVHAWEIPFYAFPDETMAVVPLFEGLEEASAEALKNELARHAKSGVPTRSVLRMGAAWREIDAVAASEKADLIVVGTHGRRGIVRFVLGSVAERVVRTASCPVLTVGSQHD